LSVGHYRHETKTVGELKLIEGEADTSRWIERTRRLKATTSYDLPYGGGAAVDASELYIDRQLYAEVMKQRSAPVHLWVTVPGMTGPQIVRAWLRHEGTEISCELGDNPADSYPACHGLATADEELGVEDVLGAGRAKFYEERIKPALARCLKRSVNKIKAGTFNPPPKLWCGPILDDPTATDLILIRGLRAKGVEDAFKRSKTDPGVMYSMGGRNCDDCANFGKATGDLAPCRKVCGMVRWNRNCLLWEAAR
jgi:hypothetical protein